MTAPLPVCATCGKPICDCQGKPIGKIFKAPIDVAELRSLLTYDPETGDFRWRKRPVRSDLCGKALAGAIGWNAKFSGKIISYSYLRKGYHTLRINGLKIAAHRAAFALYTGQWPSSEIDHINGNRLDNRIANLREVSSAENARNSRIARNNTSGTTGVYWRQRDKIWMASIWDGSKTKWLGQFDCQEDAVAARKSAERELGFHENHGSMKEQDHLWKPSPKTSRVAA